MFDSVHKTPTVPHLLAAHPGDLSAEERGQLVKMLDSLSFAQLRDYIARRVRGPAREILKHIQEDRPGELFQVLDLQQLFYSSEIVRAIRWNLAQFRINRKTPRRAPTERHPEAQELSYLTDYTWRRIVYPLVADLAKALYVRATNLNAQNADRATHYAPLLVLHTPTNKHGWPGRIAVLITPAVLTFLRGWRVFEDGDQAHAHYIDAMTRDAARIHGLESAEPGQMLYVFNWDSVFAGLSSDAANPCNAPFSLGALFEPVFEFQLQVIRARDNKKMFVHRRGGMAPFTNDSFLDLTRYQIEGTGKGFEHSKDTCFLYALRQCGVLSPDEIRGVMRLLNQQLVTFKMVEAVGRALFVRFHIHMHTRIVERGAQERDVPAGVTLRHVHLGFDFNHYYVFDATLPYSLCYVNHVALMMEHSTFPAHGNVRVAEVREDPGDPASRRLVFKYHPADKPPRTCTSRDLILALHKQGLLRPIRLDDALAVRESFVQLTHYDDEALEYDAGTLKAVKPRKQPRTPESVWFADFETTTDGERHDPYLLCLHGLDNSERTHWVWEAGSVRDMVLHALAMIVFDTPAEEHTIYFHNLNYDGAFILPYIPVRKDSIVTLGASRIIAFTGLLKLSDSDKPRPFHFRDSYAMISAPLARFGRMFGLEIHKEILPYRFYSAENIARLRDGWRPHIEEFLEYEMPSRRFALRGILHEFRDIRMLDEHDRVNALAYVRYYCRQDCRVLREGMLRFREQLNAVTKIDSFTTMTLPSVAYNYLINEACFAGCYNLSTAPLLFVRQCVTGGRCMLRRNEKQFVVGAVMDFDAVSLYPSAMARLHTLKGRPKVVDPAQHSLEWLLRQDGCFLEIDVLEVPKALDFPLISRQTEKGRHFSNEPGPMFADNITIEDIVRFHEVPLDRIRVLRGYYYDEGKNFAIRTIIQRLFDTRLRFKREGNPLEAIYKLVMNSCYGKSILKPQFKQMNTVDRDGLERALVDNSADVLCWEPLYDGDHFLLKQSKPLLCATGFPTFGVQVLSMSKRIMSEVMVTAQDAGIPIYYTDTDSIHLDCVSIEPLAERFRAKYGRELIGKALGQFHSDFPESPCGEMYVSRCFIGVGKKAYLDLLEDSRGNRHYHARLKGIPEQAILNEAVQRRGDDVLGGLFELYSDLYNCKPQTFSLVYEGAVRFVRDANLAYRTREEFKRRVLFESEGAVPPLPEM